MAHQLDHEAIQWYCQTHPRWHMMGQESRYRLIAEAAKESMQWWFEDEMEAAFDAGYRAGQEDREGQDNAESGASPPAFARPDAGGAGG